MSREQASLLNYHNEDNNKNNREYVVRTCTVVETIDQIKKQRYAYVRERDIVCYRARDDKVYERDKEGDRL